MDKITASIRINERTLKQISFGLIALMMTCGAGTIVSLISHLQIGWQPWYLVGLVCFIVLERLSTFRRFRDLSLLSKEWAISLGTEWIVLLALIKLVTGLSHGAQTFLTEIPRWGQDFQTEFFSPDFLFATLLVLIFWLVSGEFANILDDLGYEQALITQQFPALESGKASVRERLLSLIFGFGTVLILLTALVRVDFRAVLAHHIDAPSILTLPALDGGGTSTLLYFMLSLALLSLTQFSELHTRWSLENLPINPELAGRWALYSLLFLGLLAGLVSLLPTSYSLGLLNYLGEKLSFIANFLFGIVQALISFIIFLINLPFLLFAQKGPLQELPISPLELKKLAGKLGVEAVGSQTLNLWAVLKTFGFWAILVGILIFSLIQYLRQHQEVLAALRKIPGLAYLIRFWKWLQGLFTSAQIGLAAVVKASRERLSRQPSAAPAIFGNGFFNLRRLNPRQKVYFYYLALIRRSGETGLPRRPAQTPSEFAAALEAALPTADHEIESITRAFIEARYTRQPVEPEKASRIKEVWDQLNKALRGKKLESGK